MTTTQTISRERLEEIKEFGSARIITPINDNEILALVDIALAALDSEPSGYLYRTHTDIASTTWRYTEKLPGYVKGESFEIRPQFEAAPPAQVAVPDERAVFEAFMEEKYRESIDRRCVKNGDGEYIAWDMQVAWKVWQKRAAMQAEHDEIGSWENGRFTPTHEPVTAATDWIAEAKKLAEMYGTSFVVFRNGEEPECADPSKVIISFTDAGLGYPAAPEQEV